MVVPVGENVQELILIEKAEDGAVTKRTVAAVRFVPMVHGREHRDRPENE
jgi:protein-L-isoaspartate O-methyltransferase